MLLPTPHKSTETLVDIELVLVTYLHPFLFKTHLVFSLDQSSLPFFAAIDTLLLCPMVMLLFQLGRKRW